MSLTESEIESLDGPELDAAVAEYVLRWKVDEIFPAWLLPTGKPEQPYVWTGYLAVDLTDKMREDGTPWGWLGTTRFSPSTDWNLASLVIERLRELGFGLFFEDMRLNREAKDQQWWYEVNDWRKTSGPENFGSPRHYYELDGGAETFPKAVCQAALKAVLLDGMKEFTDEELAKMEDWADRLLNSDDSGTTIPL